MVRSTESSWRGRKRTSLGDTNPRELDSFKGDALKGYFKATINEVKGYYKDAVSDGGSAPF